MPDASRNPAPGTAFPPLDLLDATGGSAPLADLVAGRPAIVHFMRSPGCPVCFGHIAQLQRMRERGDIPAVDLVVVVPGAPADADAVARRAGEGVVVRASGGAHSAVGLGRFLALQHSGTFVLDADGTVLSAVTSANPMASFSRAEVVRAFAGDADRA